MHPVFEGQVSEALLPYVLRSFEWQVYIKRTAQAGDTE